jgi:hypothetical protein
MPDQAAPGTVRSAQEIRERLSSFQRGASAGRAAGEGGQADADEDEWEGNE